MGFTMSNKVWTPFYEALASFYEELLDENGEIKGAIYESKTYFYKPPKADKHYRAVLRVDNAEALKDELDELATAFYAAHRAANKEKKGYDPTKIPKLPMYLPRINEDENIFKMQVHENKAHSSTNYKKDEMIPVMSILRGALNLNKNVNSNHEKASNGKDFYDTVQALRDDGYNVEIDKYNESPFVIASIKAERLCELYKCDSIQRRFFTGRQIRANFFTKTDGKLERSTLKSVGVLLTDTDIEVVRSHERTTRTDAIYTAQHPDEIVLEVIPDALRSGRLYKKYKVE